MKPAPPPARASYHHGDLRRALLDSSLRLIADRGPEGFSLREAAREVGVSPAAAYRHFADKPELLAALAAEGHGRMAAAMEKAVARLDAPEPRARAVGALVAIGEAYLDFALKHSSFFRVMFGSRLRECGYEPACAPSGRTPYDLLGAALDGLVASGALPAARRPGAEIVAWSAVHGFSTLMVDGAMPLTARQRSDAFRVLIRGVLHGIGCEPALVPPAPAGWKDLELDHRQGRGPGGERER